MVELLLERLEPFPAATAQIMDGQALTFEDSVFDAALSIFGVSLFQNWRKGLAEQTRVLRPGGKAVLATWRTMPGGGPFLIMAEAMRAVFPDRAPPPAPEGFLVLADPDRMGEAMRGVGLVDVKVEEIEAVWDGPSGRAYLREMHDFHRFMPPYAALDAAGRARIDDAILTSVDKRAVDGRLSMRTLVTLGTGSKI
jgi:SAM-dependent methyltransferase